MAHNQSASLPWEALKHTEGDIPWPAIEQFADALAADPELWPRLRKLYEDHFDTEETPPSYEWLYVPAISAMAAPRLGPETRYEIAEFLVDEIIAAAEDEDDLLLEVVEAACGSLGPVALRPILDALDEMDTDDAGWGSLWYMTALAAESPDAAVRKEVAERAIAVLSAEERGEAQADEAYTPAYTLAQLKWTEARPLIERRWERTRSADLREVLRCLDGTPPVKEWREVWKVPVRQWLEGFWHAANDDYQLPPEEEEEERDEDDDEGDDEEYEEGEPSYELESGDGEEAEEEVEPTPPVQAAPTVGRNDPCPCGSGKKYKKCCGR